MTDDFVSFEELRLTREQRKAVGFLAEFSKRMVVTAYQEHKTSTGVVRLVNEVHQVSDEIISGCLKNGAELPCKRGCSWCCYLRVKVTPLEIITIIDFLRSHLKTGALSALRKRLAATDDTTRGMNGYQRAQAKIACPLLADGGCLAYPVRPIGCRVYHSLNASDCQALLDDPDHSITIRHDISGMGLGIFAGLTEGLQTVGIQRRLLELTAGLRAVMENPGEVCVDSWLADEPIFAGSEITSAKRKK